MDEREDLLKAFFLEMAEVMQRLSDAKFPSDAKTITALTGVSILALINATKDAAVAEHIVTDMFELLKDTSFVMPPSSTTLH